MRDYLADNEQLTISIGLLHTKASEDESTDAENIQLPVTLYEAVIGRPDVVDPDKLPAYDKAPFNFMVADEVTMTEDELNRLYQSMNIWI